MDSTWHRLTVSVTMKRPELEAKAMSSKYQIVPMPKNSRRNINILSRRSERLPFLDDLSIAQWQEVLGFPHRLLQRAEEM